MWAVKGWGDLYKPLYGKKCLNFTIWWVFPCCLTSRETVAVLYIIFYQCCIKTWELLFFSNNFFINVTSHNNTKSLYVEIIKKLLLDKTKNSSRLEHCVLCKWTPIITAWQVGAFERDLKAVIVCYSLKWARFNSAACGYFFPWSELQKIEAREITCD